MKLFLFKKKSFRKRLLRFPRAEMGKARELSSIIRNQCICKKKTNAYIITL